VKRVVPFLKVDSGPGRREGGVQLMETDARVGGDCSDKDPKPSSLCWNQDAVGRQASHGAGITDVVTQQFEAARRSSPRTLCRSSSRKWIFMLRTKPRAEELLQAAILEELDDCRRVGRSCLSSLLPFLERRPVRRIRQPSQGREGWSRLSGRLYTRRMPQALAEEFQASCELFAGAGGGAVAPAIRREYNALLDASISNSSSRRSNT